ncbi:MAG: right-handed parallel beta-helix repeat-containing protein, partial [bacterium]
MKSVVLALIMVLTIGSLPAGAATLTVDDDVVDCPGAAFTTIEAAVLAAADGDTIEVCSGVYVEQVELTKRLTLQARPGHLPLVQAPPAMAEPRAIIRVGAGFVVQVTIEGLTVTGPGGAGCGSIRAGIRVDSGATATIRNNRITGVHEDPLGACASGVGILVGRQSDGTTGTATIVGNAIEGYQKAGIVIDNAGSSASIRGNRIAGVGPTGVVAQSGIQVS